MRIDYGESHVSGAPGEMPFAEPPRGRLGLRFADGLATLVGVLLTGAVLANVFVMQSGTRPGPLPGGTAVPIAPVPTPKPQAAGGAAGTHVPAAALSPNLMANTAVPITTAPAGGILGTVNISGDTNAPAAPPEGGAPMNIAPQRAAAPHQSAAAAAAAAILMPPAPVPGGARTAVATRPPARVPGIALSGADTVTGSVRPPAELAPSSRILGVQKTLAKLGYGPLKLDGKPGLETRLAVQRFERDRNLPPDGEISDRVVKELIAVSGSVID
ncbi:peptidoglycan-binding domain-containing protein [Roseixanthobacter glucoisosaccharinicivorans]|uniref:peptidoglycan-binding domain-containing protein n=1 Tax=Roseixanthobacter glucoisosaccharinicivorans TaxID=3119923 RepID=UPI003727BCBB